MSGDVAVLLPFERPQRVPAALDLVVLVGLEVQREAAHEVALDAAEVHVLARQRQRRRPLRGHLERVDELLVPDGLQAFRDALALEGLLDAVDRDDAPRVRRAARA